MVDTNLRAGPGEVLVLTVDTKTNVKRAVIQRDTDMLTDEEMIKHKDELRAAMLKELETWQKFLSASPGSPGLVLRT